MAIVIYPYKVGSKSAKDLANKLDVKRVYSNKAYRNKGNDLIVNWGNSQTPSWPFYNILNKPDKVANASNKLSMMQILVNDGVTPRFTEDINKAKEWLETREVSRVYCRKLLTSHSGNGIIIAEKAEDIVQAPLYVQGITGLRDEYRVHVFNEEIIDVQMRRKRRETETNQLIRNYHNGYVYCRENVPELPHSLQLDCKFVVKFLGLHFGAVDVVVMRDRPDKHYILEVNTAPGLEGTTLNKYAKAIESYYNGT